jgi:hypothetical protein
MNFLRRPVDAQHGGMVEMADAETPLEGLISEA